MMETEQNNIYIFITTAIDEFPNSTAIFRRDQQTFDYPIPDKINIIQNIGICILKIYKRK